MNCPNCGIAAAEGETNCQQCGHLLSGALPAQPQPEAPAQQPYAPAPRPDQQANYQPPGQPQGYQQSQQTYQPPVFGQPVYNDPVPARKDTATAVILELVGGGIFQVFGIGNIYAGNVGIGIALMISYWVLQAINAMLTILLIGFVTLPLTWLIYMILGSILASGAAKRTQG